MNLQNYHKIASKKAFMVAGLTSGSGKTTITQGFLALFVNKGFKVQSFKLGPDYIDSAHHSFITQQKCVNLDNFLFSTKTKTPNQSILKKHFDEYASLSDVSIVEAVGGIFDDWEKINESPADIAIALNLGVILVADGFSYCQTLGIMLNSVISHNPKLNIIGIIINKIHSESHYQRIVDGVDNKYKHMILGFIKGNKKLFIEERHLGLVTAPEILNIKEKADETASNIEKFINYENFLQLISHKQIKVKFPVINNKHSMVCKIGIPYDKAFSFYYRYNLEYFESLGAELFFFSPLNSTTLPHDIDGLYLGGGFPEMHAKKLSENNKLLEQIKQFAESEMPIYAECGGLLYLSKYLTYHKTGKQYLMSEILPLEVKFNKPLVLDYFFGEILEDSVIGKAGDIFCGHLFHSSSVNELGMINKTAILKSRSGNIKAIEGYVYKNVYATYGHVHFLGSHSIADNFVNAASLYRKTK